MKIVVLSHSEDFFAADIVTSALIRSFTYTQVRQADYQSLDYLPEAAVLICPRPSDVPLLKSLTSNGRKILLLGVLDSEIAQEVGLISYPFKDRNWGDIIIDIKEPFNTTRVKVTYNTTHPLGKASAMKGRHLCRYDFADEWNNLGYGCITSNGDIWSVCNIAIADGATAIARLENKEGSILTVYAAVFNRTDSSILWYNRRVGPVDSLEWTVIERFFGDYRHEELSSFPYLPEVPYGFEGAFTMRLDCDQAVSSARPLFELYKALKVPFSLAIMTGLKMDESDRKFLNDIIESGGSLVSHSHNHPSNWGGTYKAAFQEALVSKRWLEDNTRAEDVKYAVSPFHQNPAYALEALADVGYRGFIGGIIYNDPEFLLGRAGQVPVVKKKLISLSQQCMLHGDCYHRYGNSIDIYKESFKHHVASGSIFGYLDHPFSKEYSYGWKGEEERIGAHKELLEFMLSFGNIWRCSISQCLDFLMMRDSASIIVEGSELEVKYDRSKDLPPLSVKWRGELLEA
ncbi:MAG: polysaccharide deacetylase family protein [Nitrospiria bacterium]